ncbi:amidohydrolase family protein [Streptomyces sp. NPDC057636]|uniref:amidohydrolase family protein n=1 Tax=Streptomyces sp. NPDC057636 TaxID=3346189 RepID=UPI0036C935A1
MRTQTVAPRSWPRSGRGPVRQPDGASGLRRLLAALHERLDLRPQVQPAAVLIRAATTTAARRLLREEGRVGTLAVGAQADLLVLDGSPLEDISVLTKPREHLRHVIKAGTPM